MGQLCNHGQGWESVVEFNPSPEDYARWRPRGKLCERCKGQGWVVRGLKCLACKGSGRIKEAM